MHLKQVTVGGFWGRAEVNANLKPGVNIFLGPNGSGKTTLLNIINAVLTVDIAALDNPLFDWVRISFGGRKTAVLKVTHLRAEDDGLPFVEYKLGTKVLERLPLGASLYRPRMRYDKTRVPSEAARKREELVDKLEDLSNVRWLSVNRYGANDLQPDYSAPERMDSPVDAKLASLLYHYSRYQAALDKKARDLTTNFRKDVTLNMLFDPQFDSYGQSEQAVKGVRPESQRTALEKAFKEMGVEEREAKPRIDQHIEALNRSVQAFRDAMQNPGRQLLIDDVLPLSLLKRTERIVQLVNQVDEHTKRIYQKREDFTSAVNSFFEGKRLWFNNAGEVQISIIGQKTPLPVFSLSSGEKQLLIQLIEALLQEEKNCVFMADEPELSLHVDWQSKLLASIAKLNPNAQIIVATHSPEIVADYGDCVVQMAEVVCEDS